MVICNILDTISVFLNLLWLFLWPTVLSILENVPCVFKNNAYSAVSRWNALYITIKSTGLMCHLKFQRLRLSHLSPTKQEKILPADCLWTQAAVLLVSSLSWRFWVYRAYTIASVKCIVSWPGFTSMSSAWKLIELGSMNRHFSICSLNFIKKLTKNCFKFGKCVPIQILKEEVKIIVI